MNNYMSIPDYPAYCVDRKGNIWSIKRNKYLKAGDNGNGYKFVALSRGHRVLNTKYVHRLVAQVFIPNPKNYPEVNHIDGNKANNHISNLEWCTRTMNSRHAHGHKDYLDSDNDRKHLQDRFNDYIEAGVAVERALYALH